MIKSVFLLVFLSFIPFVNRAQEVNTLIEDLKLELKSKPDAKKTATIYSDLTWYYSNVSIDSALHYGGKAIAESKKLGDSTLLSQVYSDIGAVYFRKGDYTSSKENYLTSYKIRKAKKDYSGMAKVNINLASIYGSNQQFKLAMTTYLEALTYFESSNNGLVVSSTKANIGYIFRELKNYPKAIKYLSEANEYEQKNKLFDKLCTSCLNIGNVYLEMKDTLKALDYYKKSLKACIKTGDKNAIASIYNNIGTIKSAQDKSKEALSLFGQSGKVRDELNSDLDKASLQLNIAKEYTKEKKYKEAQALLLKIKKVFEKMNSKDNLVLTYNQLIPVYANLKQPDSVTFYAEKYAFLKDQLLNEAVLKQTTDLEAKYQTEKKEKQLLKSKAEIVERELEIKSRKIQFLVLALISLALLTIIYLVYRQQKLKNKQQEQDFQLKTAISKIETQNKLQEQRLTISRDLHDNIGSQLTFIISSVDTIKYSTDIQNPLIEYKLDKISDFTKETIVELRDTIWAMNNNAISFEDLKMRLLNFVDKASGSMENTNFKIAIDGSLNDYQWSSVDGMNIYRSIQEALNNAMKYANAKEIAIAIENMKNQISIVIKDDGVGFDASKTVYGNGIANMKKRIEDSRGQFTIQSSVNKGTTIAFILNK